MRDVLRNRREICSLVMFKLARYERKKREREKREREKRESANLSISGD